VDIVYRRGQPDDRRRAVQNLLAEHRLLLIGTASRPSGPCPILRGDAALDEAGCQQLLDFLELLAGRRRSAVLLTSRTS
jgi:hypothetical protein